MKVILEVSGHHCHIARADLDALYGAGYQLTPVKPLSQTGQFAAQETVTIKAGNRELREVRILGPERKYTQVEISRTEAYHLKIDPPIRECTQPESAHGCALIEIAGPKGSLRRCAVIIAHRHFHTDPQSAKKYGVKAGQMVSVKTAGPRSITFNNILVRVDPSFEPRIHLDTDEANAAGIKTGDRGELIFAR